MVLAKTFTPGRRRVRSHPTEEQRPNEGVIDPCRPIDPPVDKFRRKDFNFTQRNIAISISSLSEDQ